MSIKIRPASQKISRYPTKALSDIIIYGMTERDRFIKMLTKEGENNGCFIKEEDNGGGEAS